MHFPRMLAVAGTQMRLPGPGPPREFFGWGSPLIKQTAWGCGGMAAWRAGCPLNPIHGMYMPTDILKIMDATVVT
jgi:hypothetical protein